MSGQKMTCCFCEGATVKLLENNMSFLHSEQKMTCRMRYYWLSFGKNDKSISDKNDMSFGRKDNSFHP